MRVQAQIWSDSDKCHVTKWVNEEVKPIKKSKRFRGDNKISNFKDKAKQRKKDSQLYKRGTVWTQSQQADKMHAMRQCHNTLTKLIHLENQGLLDTI